MKTMLLLSPGPLMFFCGWCSALGLVCAVDGRWGCALIELLLASMYLFFAELMRAVGPATR